MAVCGDDAAGCEGWGMGEGCRLGVKVRKLVVPAAENWIEKARYPVD